MDALDQKNVSVCHQGHEQTMLFNLEDLLKRPLQFRPQLTITHVSSDDKYLYIK